MYSWLWLQRNNDFIWRSSGGEDEPGVQMWTREAEKADKREKKKKYRMSTWIENKKHLLPFESISASNPSSLWIPRTPSSRWSLLIQTPNLCSPCKKKPSVRPEEESLPAGLCKLLELKNYMISYHSSVLLSGGFSARWSDRSPVCSTFPSTEIKLGSPMVNVWC